MKNLIFLTKEHIDNSYKIFRLSWHDFTVRHRGSYLDILWVILGPLIQIGVYWFVFGLGIRNGRPIDGIPFLPWMLSGLIPWFFINSSIIQGANSISAKQGIITKMRFPISIIPLSTILVQFYNHLVMLLMLIITNVALGYKVTFYALQLIYYLSAGVIFLTSLAWITSTLVIIIKDIQKLIQSTMRLIFYLTPILWSPSNLPKWLQILLENSPIYYLVQGYRNSLLYYRVFYIDLRQTLIFWIITICFILIGSSLQMRFRNKFIDLL